MFVSCSETSIYIYIIVKRLQHVGIIWACSLPGVDLLSFSVPGRTEKIAGLWFARGVQSPSLNYAKCDHLTSLKSQKFFCRPWYQTSNLLLIKFLANPLELLIPNRWFSGPKKVIENEASTCQYYKSNLGSCWSKLTKLTELFPGRLSHEYFRGLHIISCMIYCNRTQTHKHLVCKWTLNHLAKLP